MNSRKPMYEDDFDQLVRHTLKNKFGTQQPSNRIWRRIKGKLTGVGSGFGQFLHLRSSLVVQIALLLFLLTLGGAESLLEQKLSPMIRGTVITPVNYTPAPRAVALAYKNLEAVENVELPQLLEAASLPLDDQDIQLLNVQLKRQMLSQNNRRPERPLSIPPTDVFPHRDSLEGRVLLADVSQIAISESEALVLFVSDHYKPGVIR